MTKVTKNQITEKKDFNKAPLIFVASITIVNVILTILTLVLREYLDAVSCDKITVNFVQYLVFITGAINSIIPFSTFEFFVVCSIISLIALITLFIIGLKKRFFYLVVCGVLSVVTAISGILLYYTFTTSFAYNRSPVPVPSSSQTYTNDDVIQITQYFLDDYNAISNKLTRDKSGNVICPYSLKTLSKLINKEYDKINDGYFYKFDARGKQILNGWIMTAFSITGVTFTPSLEPCVNSQIPSTDKTQVLAHEIAHSKGVMREGDANFISYYVLINSDNEYLRYCGYFAVFGNLLSAVDVVEPNRDNYINLQKQIDAKIITEQRNSAKFWLNRTTGSDFISKVNRFFGRIGDFFNDLYLKLNGAKSGTGSYSDKVDDGSIEDTGQINPDTQRPIFLVNYNSVQKMFFAIYENKTIITE